jgi:biopolymer transport protein ExbD
MRIPRQEPEKARIEVIPMIDIVFFLLVFFMISTLSMTVNRSLPVNLPKAAASQQELAGGNGEPDGDQGRGAVSQQATCFSTSNLLHCKTWQPS